MTQQITAQSLLARLRPTTEDDLDFVLATERDEDNAPFIRDWSRERHRASFSEDDAAHLMVEAPDGRPVGYVILLGLANPDQSIEFKRIAIADKRNGFGREAVRLVKQLAFGRLGAHRLWLGVLDGNDRARSLYDSEGFVFEGTQRDPFRIGDKYVSLHILSMLEHEYSG